MQSKKEELQDAIYKILLQKESCYYNELYRETQEIESCASGTFAKYLNEMVKVGVVNRHRRKKNERYSRYWLDPWLKTINKMMHKMNEKMSNANQRLIEVTQELLETYRQNPKKPTYVRKATKSVIYEAILGKVTEWYKEYSFMMFMSTCGLLPKISEKEFRLECESRLREVEDLLTRVKKLNPSLHQKLCDSILNKMNSD